MIRSFRELTQHPVKAPRIRCHGDYHLGQVLWTGKDFVIIDFEGEPLRSIGERRLKRSQLQGRRRHGPQLRLRRLDGAPAALGAAPARQPLRPSRTATAAGRRCGGRGWAGSSSGRTRCGWRGGPTLLPENRADTELLLRSWVLEKALYEVRYELNSRPDWAEIPLRAILSILAGHAAAATAAGTTGARGGAGRPGRRTRGRIRRTAADHGRRTQGAGSRMSSATAVTEIEPKSPAAGNATDEHVAEAAAGVGPHPPSGARAGRPGRLPSSTRGRTAGCTRRWGRTCCPAAASTSPSGRPTPTTWRSSADFNGWDKGRHPMRQRGQSGLWEATVPEAAEGAFYKYHIASKVRRVQGRQGRPVRVRARAGPAEGVGRPHAGLHSGTTPTGWPPAGPSRRSTSR